jgi:hypothetical protein
VVFRLPAEYGVLFWRARHTSSGLDVQIEVARRHRAAAVRDLAAGIAAAYGIEARVEALPPGSLVSARVLTAAPEVMKPRSLFLENEDWERAVRYY